MTEEKTMGSTATAGGSAAPASAAASAPPEAIVRDEFSLDETKEYQVTSGTADTSATAEGAEASDSATKAGEEVVKAPDVSEKEQLETARKLASLKVRHSVCFFAFLLLLSVTADDSMQYRWAKNWGNRYGIRSRYRPAIRMST